MNWRRGRVAHEVRVVALAVLAGLPAVWATWALLILGGFQMRAIWTVGLLVSLVFVVSVLALRDAVARPLQTVANLLLAVREGDYSLRGRSDEGGALGEALTEVNLVATMLRERRLEEAEAVVLLRSIMAEVEAAIFAFDSDARLRLVNCAGEKLLNRPAEALLGLSAASIGLSPVLEGEAARTLALDLSTGIEGDRRQGAWELRRGSYRYGGRPHRLVILTDMQRALRAEEREAWMRLIRVLGHEINNSMAPIQSLAASLQSQLARPRRPVDWEQDLASGLGVIGRRAESLGRFMAAYTLLARLPSPTLGPVQVAGWVARAVAMEPRLAVEVLPGPDVTLEADADQLDQLLINLLRNAVDAALETGGTVQVGWAAGTAGRFELWVRDEGPGVANPSNLFVPFFTTKPGGSGIGLALSRQIADGHGATLLLENRKDRAGCEARLRWRRGGES